MRLSKVCFSVAGWWGIISLPPLLFTYNLVGKMNPPPLTHPEYYFGFLTIAFAWQIGFLVISADPERYRSMMVPAILEKFGYALACFVLVGRHASAPSTALFGALDLLFGVGFLISWRSLGSSAKTAGQSS